MYKDIIVLYSSQQGILKKDRKQNGRKKENWVLTFWKRFDILIERLFAGTFSKLRKNKKV